MALTSPENNRSAMREPGLARPTGLNSVRPFRVLSRGNAAAAKNEKKVSVQFMHGLGDCSNFAHQIPLWTSRGYEVEVQCNPRLDFLFEAAGAKIVPTATHKHAWKHPPNHYLGTYKQNKSADNLNAPCMPHVGHTKDLWDEYLTVKLTAETKQESKIAGFLSGLQRPIILTHCKGVSLKASKDLHEREELYKGLLDFGSVVALGEDSYRRLGDKNIKRLVNYSILDLLELIKQADLLCGVDSGPLHLARWTDTPAIGMWRKHLPQKFILPRTLTINVCPFHDNYEDPINEAYNLYGYDPTGVYVEHEWSWEEDFEKWQGGHLVETVLKVAWELLGSPEIFRHRAENI